MTWVGPVAHGGAPVSLAGEPWLALLAQQPARNPEAAKIVNLHFPLIYIFARIYIPNLRKLKGKCKFYIFPKT